MRRIAIIFMIFLLPLRGWAGDLMGVQMATSGLASPAVNAMPADCPMHAQANATETGTDTAPASSAMNGCSSCDLCIPMAEPADTRLDTLGFAVHAKPLASGVDFANAPAAPTLKPPIS